jgi:hypothetical protein
MAGKERGWKGVNCIVVGLVEDHGLTPVSKVMNFGSLKILVIFVINYKQKQTRWPLVCKRTIATEQPPLFDEI